MSPSQAFYFPPHEVNIGKESESNDIDGETIIHKGGFKILMALSKVGNHIILSNGRSWNHMHHIPVCQCQ